MLNNHVPSPLAPTYVIDFFSGCGGTSAGLQDAGYSIAAALDFDKSACETFTLNFPGSTVFNTDITTLPVDILEPTLPPIGEKLFIGCAPCQPFSLVNMKRCKDLSDPKRDLLYEFFRFVEYYRPDYVFIENVPNLANYINPGDQLKALGYRGAVSFMVNAADYGVPQSRKRYITLAALHKPISIPPPTHGTATGWPWVTVRDAISHLTPVEFGDPVTIPEHEAARLEEINLARIRALKPGESNRLLPPELGRKNHANVKSYADTYTRMLWDKPAPVLTTNCTNFGSGRFGHPEQDRVITVKEALLLQSFPEWFQFPPWQGKVTKARQIGNAVPPLLAKKLSTAFK